MESILTSIKLLLGITEEYDYFDESIRIHINTAFSTLTQLGVGPADGYIITDATNVWSEFIGNVSTIESVKTFVYLSVKQVFDPPQSSAAMEAIDRKLNELTFRLNVAADNSEAR